MLTGILRALAGDASSSIDGRREASYIEDFGLAKREAAEVNRDAG